MVAPLPHPIKEDISQRKIEVHKNVQNSKSGNMAGFGKNYLNNITHHKKGREGLTSIINRRAARIGDTFQAIQYMNGYHFHFKSMSMGYFFYSNMNILFDSLRFSHSECGSSPIKTYANKRTLLKKYNGAYWARTSNL